MSLIREMSVYPSDSRVTYFMTAWTKIFRISKMHYIAHEFMRRKMIEGGTCRHLEHTSRLAQEGGEDGYKYIDPRKY